MTYGKWSLLGVLLLSFVAVSFALTFSAGDDPMCCSINADFNFTDTRDGFSMKWLGQHNEADHVIVTVYADDNRSAKYQLHGAGATIIGNRTGIFVSQGQTVKEMKGPQNQTTPVEPSLTNTTLDSRATAVGEKNGDTHRTMVLSERAHIP